MNTPLIILFLNLGGGEMFIIVLFIIIFFGADKLPTMARALGRGIREMKNATAEIQREIEKGANEIQKSVNVQDEVKNIREAAQSFQQQISDGMNEAAEKHTEKQLDTEKKEENENPLAPPDAIKR